MLAGYLRRDREVLSLLSLRAVQMAQQRASQSLAARVLLQGRALRERQGSLLVHSSGQPGGFSARGLSTPPHQVARSTDAAVPRALHAIPTSVSAYRPLPMPSFPGRPQSSAAAFLPFHTSSPDLQSSSDALRPTPGLLQLKDSGQSSDVN